MDRIHLKIALFWLFFFCSSLQANEEMWPILKDIHFENKIIHDANDWLLLLNPKSAEDSAIVPITITSLKPQTDKFHIKSLHLFIDNNPMPHAAKFSFARLLTQIDISTRIRIDSFSYVRVVAEMNDGSLHMASKFIQAAGGCSAPASKDYSVAIARLGKMQIRMRKPTIGQETPVQVMISHPNSSGLQIDPVSRSYIPAHYVKEINISYNQVPLIMIEAGISISEDPSIKFKFTPLEPGLLQAKVVDSKNQAFYKEKTV